MHAVFPWDIVLVAFPFTDLGGTKLRPAVVISTPLVHRVTGDVTVLFISSVVREEILPFEFVLTESDPDFEKSGLAKASVFKAHKIATIQKRLITRRLGLLGEKAKAGLRQALEQTVGL